MSLDLTPPGALVPAASFHTAADLQTTTGLQIGRSATSGPKVTVQPPTATRPLVEEVKFGLDAPICLTWELTYACNLSCVHCLSSSGRRYPRELTT
ncbi:hypothetical protein BH10ACT3_BH10ACT3_07060 [soil metagenome]